MSLPGDLDLPYDMMRTTYYSGPMPVTYTFLNISPKNIAHASDI